MNTQEAGLNPLPSNLMSHFAPSLASKEYGKDLNVAVLVATTSAAYGGPSYSARRLWQSAMNSGVNITIHSTDTFHVPEKAEDSAAWQPLKCRTWPTSGIKQLGYSSRMNDGVLASLRDGSSIISQHGLWLHHGRIARNIGRRLKVPVIIHPYGMLEDWALRRSSWKKRIVGRLWEYENLREAACIRVTAQSEMQSVRRFGLKNPVALIPEGIDADDYDLLPDKQEARNRLSLPEGQRVLLFLSRVHPKKGLMNLLKVWKRVGAARKGWLLAIAGPDEGGHTSELMHAARELDDSVRFLGPLFGQGKFDAFAAADLFVLPSYSENFGIVVAEALSARLPVIATRGTPWQGLKEHSCGWWTQLTEQSLEDALREAMALTDVELKAMGEKGREWMRRDFGWNKIAAQIIEVCKWSLGGGAPPDCVRLN
ncbi:MAG: glycosyltransferase [Pyrinomonadaceae bacterium]|nr:glycosyltransferase [Pyrinomonadaceae bacterium]